jgi:menaquinone-dependent protoporphyrinogen oxidase
VTIEMEVGTMARAALVAYATKNGSTREVAETIAQTLEGQGFAVDTLPAAQVEELGGYDAVVVGGSIYMGRWHRDALALLEREQAALAELPLAVFALGSRTAEEPDLADCRAQLERNLAKLPGVHPCATAVFGSVIDPAKLRFPLNRLPASDARDWDVIRAWARALQAPFAAREQLRH